MPPVLTVGLFLLVLFSLGVLVKWEYRRARRYGSSLTWSHRRKLEPPRVHIPYVPPPDRSSRAFSMRVGR